MKYLKTMYGDWGYQQTYLLLVLYKNWTWLCVPFTKIDAKTSCFIKYNLHCTFLIYVLCIRNSLTNYNFKVSDNHLFFCHLLSLYNSTFQFNNIWKKSINKILINAMYNLGLPILTPSVCLNQEFVTSASFNQRH